MLHALLRRILSIIRTETQARRFLGSLVSRLPLRLRLYLLDSEAKRSNGYHFEEKGPVDAKAHAVLAPSIGTVGVVQATRARYTEGRGITCASGTELCDQRTVRWFLVCLPRSLCLDVQILLVPKGKALAGSRYSHRVSCNFFRASVDPTLVWGWIEPTCTS